jgi:hypothetical protein
MGLTNETLTSMILDIIIAIFWYSESWYYIMS